MLRIMRMGDSRTSSRKLNNKSNKRLLRGVPLGRMMKDMIFE
jgi:hypothetical protein